MESSSLVVVTGRQIYTRSEEADEAIEVALGCVKNNEIIVYGVSKVLSAGLLLLILHVVGLANIGACLLEQLDDFSVAVSQGFTQRSATPSVCGIAQLLSLLGTDAGEQETDSIRVTFTGS